MRPADCEHFNNCSANICPLDENLVLRKYLNGERVCFYLIQANKSGAKAIFYDAGKGDLYELMMLVGLRILSRHYPIKHVVNNGKKTASRMKLNLNEKPSALRQELSSLLEVEG